jgi:5'-methylthioadenosine phosphorylase
MPIGIIVGTSLFGADFLRDVKEEVTKTKYGTAYLLFAPEYARDVAFIQRHGKKKDIPPHRINHRANIIALKELGVEKIIGVTSVGSLKLDIKPKSFVVPHDYISLWNIPTFYGEEIVRVIPGLVDEGLRKTIIEVAKDLGIDIIEKGVYFQTSGPRLETKAEINLMKDYADVVGMNMASEATLATELGLKYANVSTVTNYAHGILTGTKEELSYKLIVEEASKSGEDLEKFLVRLIAVLK